MPSPEPEVEKPSPIRKCFRILFPFLSTSSTTSRSNSNHTRRGGWFFSKGSSSRFSGQSLVLPVLLAVVIAVVLAVVLLHFKKAVPVSVLIALSTPSTAVSIDPTLLCISIEQDRWTEWIGTNTTNTFFLNTLDNLKQRTGQPPWVRIGADSEDRTNFNPNVTYAQAVFPASTKTTPYPEANNLTVGDKYYQLASQLPQGTHVIWGVNLGQNNVTAAVLEAQSITKAFQNATMVNAGVSLAFIEVGNEADLYGRHGLRSSINWTIAEYTAEWTKFANNVSQVAGVSTSSSVKFLGGSFAESSHKTGSFSPQGLFDSGILNSDPGKLITTISQHHYSGSFCSGKKGLLQGLMTKSTIRSNLTQFSPDIAAARAQGLDYFLGETNSYACHGAPGVSNTAGAALWMLDYLLFAPQIGITRLFFHHGVGYKYNLIQPVTLTKSTLDGSNLTQPLGPHVQPQYYAGIIATEAIGTSGSVKAVEIIIKDNFVSGYAFFEGNDLKRAVLINSQAYLNTTKGKRPSKTISLKFSGSGTKPTTASVKRLTIGHANDGHGLTWGGQSFETSDARPNGTLSVEDIGMADSVTLSATEAILLTFS
ncbi:glycoside hydrolase family 79 protein [Rickenella mellea]|uniref:Glycoside hydrolase family 79 protein n=1 Tax=Rickenella mellea TaxID=50990 RepID=A0A4Y7Q9B1_9AGAM|nr:glycoside hydrolase family 79 protein [Rickenella mellea]